MVAGFGRALSLAVALAWQGAEPAVGTVFPRGAADAAGKVAYVQGVNGGIEALDLKTGKVLWTTEEFAQPLAVIGNKLLVQVREDNKPNALRVLTHDTANKGKKIASS